VRYISDVMNIDEEIGSCDIAAKKMRYVVTALSEDRQDRAFTV